MYSHSWWHLPSYRLEQRVLVLVDIFKELYINVQLHYNYITLKITIHIQLLSYLGRRPCLRLLVWPNGIPRLSFSAGRHWLPFACSPFPAAGPLFSGSSGPLLRLRRRLDCHAAQQSLVKENESIRHQSTTIMCRNYVPWCEASWVS